MEFTINEYNEWLKEDALRKKPGWDRSFRGYFYWNHFPIGETRTFRYVKRRDVLSSWYRWRKSTGVDWKITMRCDPPTPGLNEVCRNIWVRRISTGAPDEVIGKTDTLERESLEPRKRPWWRVAKDVYEFIVDESFLSRTADRIEVAHYRQNPDGSESGINEWRWALRVPHRISRPRMSGSGRKAVAEGRAPVIAGRPRSWDDFNVGDVWEIKNVSLVGVRRNIVMYCLIRNLKWRLRIAQVKRRMPATPQWPEGYIDDITIIRRLR